MRTLKRIGIKSNHYPEIRNFSGFELENYLFKKKLDFYRILAFAYFKVNKKSHPRWLNLYWSSAFTSISLYHFFNAVNVGNTPWVVTYEYYLPRGAHQFGMFKKEDNYIDFALKRLAHPSCKKIIALSNFALEAQKSYLKDYGKYANEILSKIEVWHPGQKLYVTEETVKIPNDSISFAFVGADFFRKGGMEILIAFEEVTKEFKNIKLTIVSKMQFGDYASKSTKIDKEKALDIIESNENINYFDSLPNSDVIELFKSSDVALLPSYDETYGYTVLEAQACGCPVVTTNGSAFTEINNSNCGWIIEVPLYEDGRSFNGTLESITIFRNIVVSELKKIIREIRIKPEVITLKRELSIARIKHDHNYESAKIRLENLYNQITKKS